MAASRFTIDKIIYVLIVASKDESFFLQVKDIIDHDCFKPGTSEEFKQEAEAYIIWDSLLSFYTKYQALPEDDLLALEAKANNSLDTFKISDEFLKKFLSYRRGSTINHKLAYDCLKEWLTLRKIWPTVDIQVTRQPLRSDEILQKAAEQLKTVGFKNFEDKDVLSLFECSLINSNKIATGLGFIDELIDGGFESTDVSVLLGPTGAGKTTMGIQLACSTARVFHHNNSDKKVVFLSYEDSARSISQRILSCAATIPKKRLRQLRSLNELSDARNPQQYELQIFKDELVHLIGEKERLETARDWLQNNLRAVDFSGRSDNPHIGTGGIGEIVNYLQRLDCEIGLLIIDWAGMLIRRHLESIADKDIQNSKIRKLQSLCDDCYRYIAAKFNCPVIIIHQLSGQAAKANPASNPTHADAEGCKTFAVNAWHAFVLGTLDAKTNVAKFNCTKTRADRSQSYRLLYLDGDFSRFVDVTNKYRIDPVLKKIINVGDIISRPRRHIAEDIITDL